MSFVFRFVSFASPAAEASSVRLAHRRISGAVSATRLIILAQSGACLVLCSSKRDDSFGQIRRPLYRGPVSLVSF